MKLVRRSDFPQLCYTGRSMDNFYVYQYLRALNSKHGPAGSPYYIGKGNGKRAWSSNRNIKPPKDKSSIVLLAQKMNEADAFQAEMLLIRLHGRIDKGTGCLWNMTDGGDGATGCVCSEERKAKISIANSGKQRTPETLAKLSAARRKRKITDETRAKLSAAGKRRTFSLETRARIAAAKQGKKRGPLTEEWRAKVAAAGLGRHFSAETRAKISLANKGRVKGPLSESVKAKISAVLKGRSFSDEHKARISVAAIARERKKRLSTANLDEDTEVKFGE